MAEGGRSPVTRPLPLKVPEQSLERLISSTKNTLGTAYRSGGASPQGFDCSGLVIYLYKQHFRMILPRSAQELASLGPLVARSQLQPGDLVFFSIGGDRIDHVGISIGHERFVHAANSGVIMSDLLEHYYQNHYACAARVVTRE